MDAAFIPSLIERIERAEAKARTEFGDLDAAQLNWRPDSTSWSIAQCLDHLLHANTPYFKYLESASTRPPTIAFWERIPFLPAFWGKMLLNAVDPATTKKMRAPKVFAPAAQPLPADIVATFCQQQRDLVTAIRPLSAVDLDRIIITSPVMSFVAYSLADALRVITAHDDRHLNQASRVLQALRTTTSR